MPTDLEFYALVIMGFCIGFVVFQHLLSSRGTDSDSPAAFEMHLWLDRSGSIDPHVAAHAAMIAIDEAEARHASTGIATRIQVSTFSHALGSTTTLLTTVGQPMKKSGRAKVLRQLVDIDANRFGGTDFQPVYDVADRPEETQVDHVLITDLMWAFPQGQTHPANVRYIVLPDHRVGESISWFLEQIAMTSHDVSSIRIDISR